MHNIIQVEFFLVNVQAPSLGQMLAEVVERREEGSPIKLVLRFYEDGGAITGLVKEAAYLEEQLDRALERFLLAGRFERWRLNKKSKWLAGKKIMLRGQMYRFVVKQLSSVIKNGAPFAVEQMDRRFRHAWSEELHEILESAKKARGMWVFVFSHDHLLADRLNMIGCAY